MSFPSGNLSGTNPYNRLSRRSEATGSPPPTGSRGARNTRHIPEISFPSGSILPDPIGPLESLDLAQARLKEAILFALPLGVFLWILIALVIWALFF